ncbi:MAG: cytochrome c biogenesis protein [Anaeromyxobacter sp.]
MSIIILRIATVLYVAASAAYVLYFSRPRHARLATAGFSILAVAFLVHAVAIGVGCAEFGGREFFSLRGGAIFATWMAAGAFLVVHRAYRVPTLGAFVAPLVSVVLLPTLVSTAGVPGIAEETLRTPTVFVHVSAVGLALALFGIAFGVAIMYLLQEREVKGKRFGALFSRLPSLDTLDRLNQRLVRAGWVFYTVALLFGTLTARKVWEGAWSWDPHLVISVLVWLLYGAMVHLRRTGWHGRRYALLTLVGFAIVAGSMLTLEAIPGATRHAGNYGTVQAGGAP